MRKNGLFSLFLLLAVSATGQNTDIRATISAAADKIEPKTIAWRRDFHEHPELGNREFRTSKIIADHLRSLGLEVHEGVGKTGVVGILRGAMSLSLRKSKPPLTARRSASCMPAAMTPISPL